MQSENKILDGLSYISILFAPFFFPFIVWLLTPKNTTSHYHAGRAFKLHLIPLVLTIGLAIVIGSLGLAFGNSDTFMQSLGVGSLLFLGVVLLVDLILGLYNVYYGIKLFLS
ncbi:hypothetical protein [Enterococcus sp. CSURQ0835]|uniref:hypothetical protein n=1 Tax=Enterococcus sp. CSURQ0835 TaxID=2681394 RepID=UPI00135734A8|nr:hypothetical protein [Enterococcus sp. CSURQ0835]